MEQKNGNKNHSKNIAEASDTLGEDVSGVFISGDGNVIHLNTGGRANIFKRWVKKLQNTMGNLINKYINHSSKNLVFVSRDYRNTIPVLTPSFLINVIYPYLTAIDTLQNVIDEIELKPHKEIAIKSISQQSPVSLSLDGADGAIKSIQDIIVPWRRQHNEIMARLAEQEKLAEIEAKKAEVLEKRGNAARSRAEEEKVKAETEKLKLENEKLRIELQHTKVTLAHRMLQTIAPNFSEADRTEYLIKLLPVLDVIGLSDYEIQFK